MPTPENKKKIFPGESWMLGDTFNASIGQGIDLATPIQLAMLMSCVAADGVYHPPYLVESLLNNDGSVYQMAEHAPARNIGISMHTLKLIQNALEGVAEEGGTASYLPACQSKLQLKQALQKTRTGATTAFLLPTDRQKTRNLL